MLDGKSATSKLLLKDTNSSYRMLVLTLTRTRIHNLFLKFPRVLREMLDRVAVFQSNRFLYFNITRFNKVAIEKS